MPNFIAFSAYWILIGQFKFPARKCMQVLTFIYGKFKASFPFIYFRYLIILGFFIVKTNWTVLVLEKSIILLFLSSSRDNFAFL